MPALVMKSCEIIINGDARKKPLCGASGGEGGIRTHGTLRYTRSPSARDKPDYATSPHVERRNYIMFISKKLAFGLRTS